MVRNTSSKRKSASQDAEPTRQPRKIQQPSDDDISIKFNSYSSRIFNFDILALLNKPIICSQWEIFFNYRKHRDEKIKTILMEYEISLMKKNLNDDDEFGTKVETFGKMNIKNSIQFKRNQCKVLTESETDEMYLCVNSEEFTSCNAEIYDYEKLLFDRWLVYRCDAMKTTDSESGYKVFQTRSTMIGNNIDTKSFHWLGFHGAFNTKNRLYSE
ncbi:predicted protein [Naegleria gruberi]|uniref:Predicted protein n=1 Tax=Naegleria gruberi TaxID=5762 RepID=D2W6F0_NAEGR|nr:uncharacterized protein NAEGRDRAFT_76993 [Naegleria gruberi]EFC35352.1 predicted protein [Naegleria gruberi]|eukprot:XP_002668096.1 predicted protein [Naegleria gruberi strain NEG-M]